MTFQAQVAQIRKLTRKLTRNAPACKSLKVGKSLGAGNFNIEVHRADYSAFSDEERKSLTELGYDAVFANFALMCRETRKNLLGL